MTAFNPVEKSLCLHKVCEANYRKLASLVPGLLQISDIATAVVAGKPALHLRLIERSPFTLLLELTHDFADGHAALAEPAVMIRVCLDARTVEMLSDYTRPLVHQALSEPMIPSAVLDYKWSLNYFLSRWLDHCLVGHYQFRIGCPEVAEVLFPSTV
jgi:uncharacterized protein